MLRVKMLDVMRGWIIREYVVSGCVVSGCVVSGCVVSGGVVSGGDITLAGPAAAFPSINPLSENRMLMF